MAQRRSRQFPMLKSSRKIMNFVQLLVLPARSVFQKLFKKCIYFQFGLTCLFSFVKLAVATRMEMDVFKPFIEFVMASYGFGTAIMYRRSGDSIFQLVRTLKNGISNYSCFVDTLKVKDRLKLNATNRTAIIAEAIILLTFLKAIYDFIIFPLFFIRHEFESSPTKLIITIFTGLPDNTSFFIYVLGFIFFYIPHVMFVGSLSNFWQIVLINSISCLEGELKILAGFLENIEQTANALFEDVKVNMMFVDWSELLRASRSYPVWDPANTWSDDDDVKLKEITLYDCLSESALHHQNIYRCCIRLNKCLRGSIFLFGQSIILSLGLAAFMLTQSECRTTSNCPRILLFILPSVVAQGFLCILGQTLYNESKHIWTVLNGGNWFDKSERIILTARTMMNQAVEPIVLSAVTFDLYIPGFFQLAQATYTTVLILTSKRYLTQIAQTNNEAN